MPDLYKKFPHAGDQIDNFMSQSNILLYSTPLVIVSKVRNMPWRAVYVGVAAPYTPTLFSLSLSLSL